MGFQTQYLVQCVVSCNLFYAMRHGHGMLYALYVSLFHVITTSSLSTSFSTACPSISEVIDILGNRGSNTGNLYQSLVLGFTLH